MSIFSRMQRLAKANLNALLDKVEDPEKVLKQRIKELEDAIREAKEAAAGFAVTLKKMEREQNQAKRLRDEWEQKAERCVDAGDEDGAKRALREKLRADERARGLEPSVEQSRDSYTKLKDSLRGLNDQLSASRLKLSELAVREKAADAQKAFGKQFDKARGAAVGDGEFTRMEENVLQKESEVELDREIRGEVPDDEAMDEKSRNLQVESELDELKKRMGK